ncbi:MAG: hypothetical protein Aurels2KO_33010 [Aureliella sp.]
MHIGQAAVGIAVEVAGRRGVAVEMDSADACAAKVVVTLTLKLALAAEDVMVVLGEAV